MAVEVLIELLQIAADLFGLSHVVIQCNPGTTLDEFSNSLLTESDTQSGLLENEADDPDKIEVGIEYLLHIRHLSKFVTREVSSIILVTSMTK